jgi:5-methylcytosine-specific restriction endonuclease McrA
MKLCTSCGIERPLSWYCKMKLSPDGRSYYCRECRSKVSKQWRTTNPTYRTEWRIKNPYSHNNHERKRRDLKKKLDYMYSVREEIVTRSIFCHVCFNCGSKENLEIDHHIPLSSGCGLSLSNAVLLCNSCNCSKHDRMPKDFYSPFQLYQLDYILELVGELQP